MIILRLGTSEDVVGDVPLGARSWKIAERMLAQASGEEVETVLRRTRPTPSLPSTIESWMQEYRPDIVFLWVSAYWMTYESVPTRLEHRLGTVGRPLVALGRSAGQSQWFARKAAFRAFRKGVYRVVGGDAAFTPAEVIERMKECIRLILRHEHATLLVRTPLKALVSDCTAEGRRRGEARRQEVHRALRDFCAGLHVHYLGHDTPFIGPGGQPLVQDDKFHRSYEGHQIIGAEEGEAMLTAWRGVHALR